MSYSVFASPWIKSIGRIAGGIAIAIVLYHLAGKFASSDCGAIQADIRSQGLWMMGRILFAATLAALLGTPAALIAVATGIWTGPIAGAPLASFAISVSSLIYWIAGRLMDSGRGFPGFLEKQLRGPWYQTMMDDHSISGFHWTALHGMTAPIPYPFFAFIIGGKVRHLNAQSFLSGIFMGSILHVAGYSLAGASIGCAVINHALGFSIGQYRGLMAISCLILILLSRLQAHITERNAR